VQRDRRKSPPAVRAVQRTQCVVTGSFRIAPPSPPSLRHYVVLNRTYGGMFRLREQDSLQVGNPVVGFREPMLRDSSARAADE
jgi:hypothetical protein